MAVLEGRYQLAGRNVRARGRVVTWRWTWNEFSVDFRPEMNRTNLSRDSSSDSEQWADKVELNDGVSEKTVRNGTRTEKSNSHSSEGTRQHGM